MQAVFVDYYALNILWVGVDSSSTGETPQLLCNHCCIVFQNLVGIFHILQPFHSVVPVIVPEGK